MNVAVVLPAYNEENDVPPLIGELVDIARRDRIALHVIVVDDGSIDGLQAHVG